jgi:hypothetical protein
MILILVCVAVPLVTWAGVVLMLRYMNARIRFDVAAASEKTAARIAESEQQIRASTAAITAATGLAMVHAGETVVPAMPPIRGGGGGGSTIHLHVHAWDTVTGIDQLAKHADFINAMVYDANGVRRP